MNPQRSMRASVDVGGTFTDVTVLGDDGRLRQFKSPTTFPDPSLGFLDALRKAAAGHGRELPEFLGDIDVLVHGTTLATNALIDGSGARVGLLTTEGFRDVLEIRRGHKNVRSSMYDLFHPPYKPLVPRRLRREVSERMLFDGSVHVPLDEDAVRREAEELAAAGVEAVAVCFLHSYANPEHERRAAEIARDVLGDRYVVTSESILPVWREWERFSTTVLSAYLGPVVRDYLERLDERLSASGFGGTLLLVLSDGLVETLDHCVRNAVQLLGSGPAAAPSAALDAAAAARRHDLISIDMGGTSLDVAVLAGGEIPMTRESWVEQERVAVKMVDIHSVGAGGGSIAWLDSLGLLRVGPRSAGSTPGPACYGRGGVEPTVTDADLLLGYLPSDTALGGELLLDRAQAEAALERVATPLGLTVVQAAEAVFSTVNALMADEITEVSTRRGSDVRDFTLVAGGGMGPLHGPFIAELLGVESVVVPGLAGTYSAFGMLAMDTGRNRVRSLVARIDELDLGRATAVYEELEREARDDFAAMGVDAGLVQIARTADMRYVGQFSEVEIELPAGKLTSESVQRAVAEFHRRHEELFTFSMSWKAVELLSVGVRATVPAAVYSARPSRPEVSAGPTSSRRCRFGGEELETDVYDGATLADEDVIAGPAVVEEETTTIVVPPGFRCRVLAAGGYLLTRAAELEEPALAAAEVQHV